jgi:hypothetical protein
VVRGVIAVGVERQREEISGEKLFEDVQRQMIAWSELVEPEETIAHFEGEWTAVRVKVRLSELLDGLWKDRWLKSPPKRPQSPRKKVRKQTHGSVYRILEAHQQRLKNADFRGPPPCLFRTQLSSVGRAFFPGSDGF